jgi:hypothetical protein
MTHYKAQIVIIPPIFPKKTALFSPLPSHSFRWDLSQPNFGTNCLQGFIPGRDGEL